MLTPCVNCGFYLRQTDEFCLNCGIVNPNENLRRKRKRRSRFEKIFRSNLFLLGASLSITFLFVFLLAEQNLENLPYLRNYIWLGAFLLWMALFFLVFVLFKVWNQPPKPPHVVKYKNNLTSKMKIIDRRLAELSSRGRKIDVVLEKIRDTDGKNLQEVRRKLLAARQIVMSQYARYELQRRKIEVVRLQNGVSPYLFNLHRLNEIETEDGLQTVESAQGEAYKIRQNLTNHAAIDFPDRALPEKEAFLAQLAETEESCQKLREALLSRQAARALQDVSPIEENLQLPNSRELAHEAEIFNIQTTLTDFSESFDELEREYRRLRAEEETEAKLLTEQTL